MDAGHDEGDAGAGFGTDLRSRQGHYRGAKRLCWWRTLGLVDAKHDLLRVDFHRHAYLAGSNTTFTISEL